MNIGKTYKSTIGKDKKGTYIVFPKKLVKECGLKKGDMLTVYFAKRAKTATVATKPKGA